MASRKPLVPSSGDAGFFQAPPTVSNQFQDDEALQRASKLYLPSALQDRVSSQLSAFSDLVLSPPILAHVLNAELHTPTLTTHTTFGRPLSRLHTSEGWRYLQTLGQAEGIVGIPYEGEYGGHGRVVQMLKYHLWTPAAAMVTCPSAMTDGAARLLRNVLDGKEEIPQLERKVFGEVHERLVSRKPGYAWTSGQWMTERAGGSDVSQTETVAVFDEDLEEATDAHGMPLGKWTISGFKWFSSATDADCAVLLAQTERGLSAFLAPLRRKGSDAEVCMNGVKIQRLKNKLGTKPLPTAELELKEMRGYLLGKEGHGVKWISTVLNITRIHNAVSAVAFWGRGLGVSRAYARVRKVSGGRLLMDLPAHVKGLAEAHVKYRAYMLWTYFVVALLGRTEGKQHVDEVDAGSVIPADKAVQANLLRLLTPPLKALTAEASIIGLRECMESLGGVGYLENDDVEFNVARLFRDACVLSIWEGTTDVMAEDMVRVVAGKQGVSVKESLRDWVQGRLESWKSRSGDRSPSIKALIELAEPAIKTAMDSWRHNFEGKSIEQMKYQGRRLMQDLAWIVCAVLLTEDALVDADEVAVEAAKRWIQRASPPDAEWTSLAALDRRLVFGGPSSEYQSMAQSKL